MKGKIMKKIVLVLAVLMLAVPVMAGISVTATDAGSGVVNVSYARTGGDDVNIPRAFALDVNMSPANGTALVPTGFNSNFYVAPGTFTYNPGTGETNWGTRYVGSGLNGFIIEMGSLWATNDTNHPTQPPSSGTLFSFTVDKSCTITLAQNAQRGGVVMESTAVTFPAGYVTLTGCSVVVAGGDCYPSGKADYAEWCSMGKPASWCFPWQCHGDASGTDELFGKFYYHVGNNDLTILLANWLDKAGVPAALPADFDHKAELFGKFYYRVSNNDLTILLNNWLDKAGALGDCNAP